VSGSGDDGTGMSAIPRLDDDTLEAIVHGDDVPHDVADLASFARQVEEAGNGPTPPASPALATLITTGGGRRRRPRPRHRAPRRPGSRRVAALSKAAGIGVAAKLAITASAAAAGVMGAGAAGVLPIQADTTVGHAFEAVTTIELQETSPPTRRLRREPAKVSPAAATTTTDATRGGDDDGPSGRGDRRPVEGRGEDDHHEHWRGRGEGAGASTASDDESWTPPATDTGADGTAPSTGDEAGDSAPTDRSSSATSPTTTVSDKGR
jgi:hypothetical protein